MKLSSVEAIFRALNAADVQYLVAGGLAVNAHGYLRFTKDVDFVLRLVPDNIAQAFTALGNLGYVPSVPVTASQFADPEQRQRWIRDKGMQVPQRCNDASSVPVVTLQLTETVPAFGSMSANTAQLRRFSTSALQCIPHPRCTRR